MVDGENLHSLLVVGGAKETYVSTFITDNTMKWNFPISSPTTCTHSIRCAISVNDDDMTMKNERKNIYIELQTTTAFILSIFQTRLVYLCAKETIAIEGNAIGIDYLPFATA